MVEFFKSMSKTTRKRLKESIEKIASRCMNKCYKLENFDLNQNMKTCNKITKTIAK